MNQLLEKLSGHDALSSEQWSRLGRITAQKPKLDKRDCGEKSWSGASESADIPIVPGID